MLPPHVYKVSMGEYQVFPVHGLNTTNTVECFGVSGLWTKYYKCCSCSVCYINCYLSLHKCVRSVGYALQKLQLV